MVVDASEVAEEIHRSGNTEKAQHLGRAGGLIQAVGSLRKEIVDRHSEDARHRMKTARADAIGAFLVLLNLLESYAERGRKLGLAHAELNPPDADLRSDEHIRLVWPFLHWSILTVRFLRP